MADLKICPFCESDKLKIEMKKNGTRYFGIGQLENYTASVRCNVCHARGGTVSGYVRNRRFVEAKDWLKDEISIEELERRAIEVWNTRKPMEDAVAELEKRANDNDRAADRLCGIESKKKIASWRARAQAFRDSAEIVRGKE